MEEKIRTDVLVVGGGGFASGITTSVPSSVIDIAPTILRHLGRPHHDLDGHPLAQAPMPPTAA